MNAPSARRSELDWLRVIAFALLIVYHAAIAFVPWDVWPYRNNEVAPALELPLIFLNQWRLPLLFLISGVGTRFALSRRTAAGFLGERAWRLGLPLVFGVNCVTVFSGYLGAVAAGEAPGFLAFWAEWVQRPFLAKMQHLWFLAWLLGFTLVAMPLLLAMRRHAEGEVMHALRRIIALPGGILLPLLPLLAIEWLVKPTFGARPAMFGYAIPWDFTFFVVGYALAALGEPAWRAVGRAAVLAPVLGAVSFAGMWLLFRQFPTEAPRWMVGGWVGDAPFATAGSLLFGLLHALNAWAWCVTALALAQRWLNRPSPALGTLNEAVYPFYIVHLPVMLAVLFVLRDWPWPIAVKLPLLIVATFLGCWLLFAILRRTALTRTLFGIKGTAAR